MSEGEMGEGVGEKTGLRVTIGSLFGGGGGELVKEGEGKGREGGGEPAGGVECGSSFSALFLFCLILFYFVGFFLKKLSKKKKLSKIVVVGLVGIVVLYWFWCFSFGLV